MRATVDLGLMAEALEKARDALGQYRTLFKKVPGETPEEVRDTIQAMEGLTPAQREWED